MELADLQEPAESTELVDLQEPAESTELVGLLASAEQADLLGQVALEEHQTGLLTLEGVQLTVQIAVLLLNLQEIMVLGTGKFILLKVM